MFKELWAELNCLWAVWLGCKQGYRTTVGLVILCQISSYILDCTIALSHDVHSMDGPFTVKQAQLIDMLEFWHAIEHFLNPKKLFRNLAVS